MRKEDLKAGYLLYMEDCDGAPHKYSTVTMGRYYLTVDNAMSDVETEGLVLCTPEDLWFPIEALDDDMQYEGARVLEVWGLTRPRWILDNDTSERQLLWRRGE